MRVKIFGERSTGTRFLRETLLRNGVTDLWPGTIAELGQQHAVALPERPDIPPVDRAAIREALTDDVFARSFHLTLGWKHGAPAFDRLPDTGHDTKFVVIVKNPYSWIQSMYRKPHHNLLQGNMASLDAFVRFPWVCTGRDNIRRCCSSVADLWTVKYRSYVDLCDRRNGLVIRYEALLTDPDVLDVLRAAVGGAGSWTLPDTVAGSERDLSYYQDYATRDGWRDGLDRHVVDALNERLDPNLVEQLGYTIL